MSTENRILDVSFPAGEDLSSDQYKFVVLTSTGTVRRPDSEAETCIGILQNAPASGQAAAVRIMGISKCQMNDALANTSFVKAEFVDAADAGKGKTAAAALGMARAMVVEASGAEDDLASVLLIAPVPNIAAQALNTTTVLTDATAGAKTYTGANLVGGLILRDPAGANRSDVTPTAAQIVAAVAGAVVGSSFRFTIRNTADAAETITITAGDVGVTLSGTMTIAQNNTKAFLAVLTNVTGGAEAVTVYSLGTFVH
jgi:hypothetical protein